MMKTSSLCLRAELPLVVMACCLTLHEARSAEIRVMTGGAFAAPLVDLMPSFERNTKDKVLVVTMGMGVGQNSIPNRVRSGEAVDVIILPDEDMQLLVHEGFVIGNTPAALAKSSIGMAVRSGAPMPDISSVDALKRTLLQAKSIAYSAQVSGKYLSTELFPRLGIAEEIRNKSRLVQQGRVGTVVARGEAEIGFQQISELLPIQGIDFVGPLPAQVQKVTVFAAGVPVSSKDADAAKALIHFLTSQDSASIIAKSGLEPIASR